jgi:ribosomal protein L37AE/L43A
MSQPLAPRICPQCRAENSFAILQDHINCRRCGYTLRREDGSPITPAAEIVRHAETSPRISPRRPLRPSYSLTHVGEVDRWAQAAFNTAQNHIHRQEWDEALKSFYRALDAQRDFVDAHLWIARLVDDPAVQREHLKSVLAYNPGHLEAMRELMILDGRLPPDAPHPNDLHTEPIQREAGGAVGTVTQNLRCARCGSPNMATDIPTGLLLCDSCGYIDENGQRSSTPGEEMLLTALLQRRSEPVRWVIGERLLHCNSCGAERTIPARKLSERCPFCNSNHIIEKDALGSFQQPDGLVPFKITRKEAATAIKERLDSWMERVKGWFINNRIRRATVEGVYLPFWIFDASVQVQRVTILSSSNQRYDYLRQHRTYQPPYQRETFSDGALNVLVCAVESPPRLLTERLGGYDLGEMSAYAPQMLARYPAELYSIDFDRASLMARSKIGRSMREKYALTTSGASVNINTHVLSMIFRLVLVPVWVATLYEVDGDIRSALVNGQTGQVALGQARKARYP